MQVSNFQKKFLARAERLHHEIIHATLYR